MKNLKAHHHLVIASMLIFGVVSVWTWGTAVFAGTGGTTVEVYVGPPDRCPNIPGYQTEVPSGMLVDGDGNCYTPPPPPVDMCTNIPGDQETIPSGYYRDENGNCRPQSKPPKDVCPNLSGVQEQVPDGYENTTSGDCIRPPLDMCSNVTGSQFLVPDDMVRSESGVCFTPSPSNTTAPPPSKKPVGSSTDLKNVPAVLDPILAPIVDMIPETVKEALRSLPPVVAQTFPYFTFFILGIAAVIMGSQSVQEVSATKRIALLIKRERDVAAEKDNFIALASHYLRTPLTIMKGALDTSLAVKELSKEQLSPLSVELGDLETDIRTILTDVESNRALKGIKAPPEEAVAKHRFINSAFFWTPVIATIVIVWIANFLLGVVGEVELGTFNLFAQAGVYIAVSLLFYSAVRTRYIRRHERAYREELLKHEEVIDAARNEFIARATLMLSESLNKIALHREILKGMKSEPFFTEGYDRFDHLLQKFTLLSEIQAGTVGQMEKFDIKTAIDDLIRFYEPQLSEKKLTIVNNIKPSAIRQRHSLFNFVLGSLIDNAIKFSNEGGTITINSTPHEHSLTVQVSDYGVGIPEEKMSQLFKPFSRGTSAMEFNYEGLGFSLFLDKIIMDYVGGGITARSADNHGTTLSVTTPSV